jgi:hypothetical protein
MYIYLGLKSHILLALNLNLMFLFVNDYFKTQFTHLVEVILFGSMWLFLYIVASLTFLNVISNNLKQDTCNGYETCDVWGG